MAGISFSKTQVLFFSKKTMSDPLISVLMTSYNREKYIGEAIESVLGSTYKNFELIISDDCSKDKTVEIAHSYAIKDSRVKIHVNEKNLGDYPNRNKAAGYAIGKYIKYVDADDYIYPRGLQILAEMMEQFPEAGWGLCSLIQIKEQPYPIFLPANKIYEYNYFRSSIFQKAPLSAIIKKSVFEQEGGFAPMKMVGDFEMWNRLALKHPVLLMPDGIVWYREHGEQEVKNYRDYILQYESIRFNYLKNASCSLSKEKVNSLLKGFRKNAFKQMIFSFLKNNWKIGGDQFKIWWFYFTKS